MVPGKQSMSQGNYLSLKRLSLHLQASEPLELGLICPKLADAFSLDSVSCILEAYLPDVHGKNSVPLISEALLERESRARLEVLLALLY